MEVAFLVAVMGALTVVATYFWVGRSKSTATEKDAEG
jgi:asparagine N-glycosylation enzyme membrane subunit Stt3